MDSNEEGMVPGRRPLLSRGEPTASVASETSIANDDYASAVDLPLVHVQSTSPPILAEGLQYPVTPTPEDHEQAKQTFDGHDDLVSQSKAVLLLGKEGPSGERIREAYMALFDFCVLNILLALRDLCGRLVLKGETQQVNRVLLLFSRRWCDCNLYYGFMTLGTFSLQHILLLRDG